MPAILHLSDLHFEYPEQAARWHGQLAEDLRDGLQCKALDYIILSGDIADKALPAEYAAAEAFVRLLLAEFAVPPGKVLIVPGNHDVDWKVSTAAYAPIRREDVRTEPVARYDADGGRYLEIVTDADRYRDRFKNYAEFHGRLAGNPYPLDYAEQVSIDVLDDAKLVLVGLNSAWRIDHHAPKRSSIHPDALEKALRWFRSAGDLASYRKIAVWHHPVRGDDQVPEQGFLERLFKNKFDAVIHGHIHKSVAEQFSYHASDKGRTIRVIGAGTFGARDVTRGYPWQYNLLTVDERGIRIQTRGKTSEDGAWGPDARWTEADDRDPKPEYRVPFKPPARRERSETVPPIAGEPQTLEQLKRRLQRLDYQYEGYRIAVEALIFAADGKVLLQTRGSACRDEVGKLEGIGGELKGGHDLHAALRKHIAQEIGPQVRVAIDRLLEIRPVRFVERGLDPQDWLVISYLCRLEAGLPAIVDPSMTEHLDWYALDDIFNMPDERLSRSTSRVRDMYRIRYRDKPYFQER
jgi:calcineurin-like phosphoesterase family protein/ADP-ribose pyrophosphatase YjhB (NUDIX family)